MLSYAESFGLILFVYALGLQVGPGFFSSMRAGGATMLTVAMGVVFSGTLLAVAMGALCGVSLPDVSGILCGATTNTPALGAAQQTLVQLGFDASGAALSCALTYPLGVVGLFWLSSSSANVSSGRRICPPPMPNTERVSSSLASASRIPPCRG